MWFQRALRGRWVHWSCIVFLSSRVFSQAFAWLINDLVLLLVSCPSFIRGAKMHSERYMPVSYTEVATHAVICMHAAIRLQLVICSNDFIVRSSSWSQSSGYSSHRSCIFWYVLSSRDFRSSFCLTLWSCSVIVAARVWFAAPGSRPKGDLFEAPGSRSNVNQAFACELNDLVMLLVGCPSRPTAPGSRSNWWFVAMVALRSVRPVLLDHMVIRP